jgi:uncharacterized coiled-coil protein SlyX
MTDQQTRLEYLEERIRELDRRIAEVEHWGALLTALNEERQQVQFYLERERHRINPLT